MLFTKRNKEIEYRGYKVKPDGYAGFYEIYKGDDFITLASSQKSAKDWIDLEIDYFNKSEGEI